MKVGDGNAFRPLLRWILRFSRANGKASIMKFFKTLLLSAVAVLVLTQSNEKEAGTDTSTEQKNESAVAIDPKWVVEDGVMTLTEKGGGDIITKEQYDSFELVLDYKISKGGNSGLMYHVTEEEKTPWMTGPEIQIQDNVDGHDPQKAGWLYQFYQAETDATNPAGEWNELRILITPEKCVHWMNGTKYVEYVKGSEDWKKRYEASKFVKFPSFGKATKGHIALQDHGNMVSFRNIKIREVK